MLLSAAFAVLLGAQPAAKPFEFKDGDRVAWLGNTLVEREQRYGYWEAALIAANPDKNITFRNLGWSGDTVFGDARAGFDNAAKGFERMVSLALELKPNVIFVSFGTNEAFEGKEGLPKFEKGLEKLLDSLKPANARVVLFSPLPFQTASAVADVKAINEKLALYGDAIKVIAEKRGHYFVDLYERMLITAERVTDNGMHLNETGYRISRNTFVTSFGINAPLTPEKPFEALRAAVVAKNEQFFNKWRPQNETYLFGFRKHEQGKNAKEIAEFDPFITKAEDEIARLRKGLK